ncbi:MAG: OmpH family outer membrane protein [Desulfohalobiaceae bacterium]|nr:OmpH family outer membrane protein [Desulfohalobiaceae bacterium]
MRQAILITCVLVLFLAVPFKAQAEKIAVIDLQKILQKSNPGEEAMQELQEYQKKIGAKLQEKKKSLDKLKKDLQQQSLMLSKEAKEDKKAKYQKQAREFQSSYQRYQQKMQEKEQELREPIIDELIPIVQEYGEKHEYDLIMDKKNSGIVYNTNKLEITETIIQKLNKVWKKREKETKSEKQ